MVDPEWDTGEAGWSDGRPAREGVEEVWSKDEPWVGDRQAGWRGDGQAGWGVSFPAPAFLGGTAPFLALGVLLVIISGLLLQIAGTSDSSSEGMLDVSSWFAWLGRAVLGLGLFAAATRPSSASSALRLGLLALATWVLLGLVGASVSLFAIG